MPINRIAEMEGISDTRIWQFIIHYVEKDINTLDLSKVTCVGVDETSSRRGHNYVTLFVDMDSSKVISVTRGKDSSTVQAFSALLPAHKGSIKQITVFSSDLSPVFISGINKYFLKHI